MSASQLGPISHRPIANGGPNPGGSSLHENISIQRAERARRRRHAQAQEGERDGDEGGGEGGGGGGGAMPPSFQACPRSILLNHCLTLWHPINATF
jgi:hypothetical protein